MPPASRARPAPKKKPRARPPVVHTPALQAPLVHAVPSALATRPTHSLVDGSHVPALEHSVALQVTPLEQLMPPPVWVEFSPRATHRPSEDSPRSG
jgi:hypothetical protein